MLALSHHTHLDTETRAAVSALFREVTAERGYEPLGESKRVELEGDAAGWSALLAHDDDALIGYAHLSWPDQAATENDAASTRPRAVVEVFSNGQPPQDIERELLSATLETVARQGGGRVWSWAHHVTDQAPPQVVLGFAVQRRLAVMCRALTELPAPHWPEGVSLATFRTEQDEQAFLRVNNAAFADHPENGGWEEAELSERLAVEGITPSDLLMAWRGSELLGFHWTRVHGDGTGEVYVLAVDPAAQGMGLGRSLLHAGLAHLADRGCEEVVLYVDCEDTPAVELYRSEGFERRYDEVCYETEAPPSGSSL